MAGYNAVTAEYQHDTRLFPQGNLLENHLIYHLTTGEF
nr:Chloramphenicol O-acetyltransferase [Escherichia coli O25b:H4-ST131]